MKQIGSLALCLMAAVLASTASGQITNAIMQNGSTRAGTSRAAPAAKPIANTSIAPPVAQRPTSFGPSVANSYARHIIGQTGTSLRPNYSPLVQTLNPAFVAPKAQRSARIGEQGAITLDPATRQRELRTLAAMRVRRHLGTQNQTLATMNVQRQLATQDLALRPHLEARELPTETAPKKWRNRNDRVSYDDAFRRHWHEWHDRNWWHDHCDTIVFVTSGYYFLDGSYWYPAWGYDPSQSYYDYDGPIYTYSNLLPDEVIANVQTALQDAGYYFGVVTGSLSVETRAALVNFQRDQGLIVTGAIDEPTVAALGL